LPKVRSNIEKSCEMIAKGKADFQQVIGHVLKIFKDKFNYFKLSVGTMERLLNLMLSSDIKNLKCITNIIQVNLEDIEDYLNFCVKCFKGHFCIHYH
jgi:threonine dehydrogenase-like Zn-dependent dehydrogenase